jgi:hypothetical protein
MNREIIRRCWFTAAFKLIDRLEVILDRSSEIVHVDGRSRSIRCRTPPDHWEVRLLA